MLRVGSVLPLTHDVYRMELYGEYDASVTPGQFLNFRVGGLYLRRPLSVCDMANNRKRASVVLRVVGKGTEELTWLREGDTVDTLVGLGNGFDLSKAGDRPLLVGGGVGAAPLVWLCRELCRRGAQVRVVLGFRTGADVLLARDFRSFGASVTVVTEDGSFGEKGFVTDVVKTLSYSHFYACGPLPMFRALEKVAATDGQYSFEARMGCGFGACMGCALPELTGGKRVCKDGPVFRREEVRWES